jgi:3-oxoacyl-(acyl-carrier-protein) synthase
MERAIRGAIADAGADPAGVDLWLSSRDGVLNMDRAEAEAIDSVFGGRPPRELSVKDAIGEMAAAGGAQLVTACRAIAEGAAQRALVDSFGAGGNFLAAVMESPA